MDFSKTWYTLVVKGNSCYHSAKRKFLSWDNCSTMLNISMEGHMGVAKGGCKIDIWIHQFTAQEESIKLGHQTIGNRQ